MMDHGTFILCTDVHGKISVQTDQSCWRHLYGVETLLGAAGFPVGDFMNWRRRFCPDIFQQFPTFPAGGIWREISVPVLGRGSIWGWTYPDPCGRVDLFHPKLLHRLFTFYYHIRWKFQPKRTKIQYLTCAPPVTFLTVTAYLYKFSLTNIWMTTSLLSQVFLNLDYRQKFQSNKYPEKIHS